MSQKVRTTKQQHKCLIWEWKVYAQTWKWYNTKVSTLNIEKAHKIYRGNVQTWFFKNQVQINFSKLQ